MRHTKSTHANPTPTTDGRYLVVHFGSEGLLCYDLEGDLLWKKEQGYLFDRFFRATNATYIQGTGLGLNIVKKYLQLMAGEITFKSSPDLGTTFFIDLPTELPHEKNPPH